LEVSVQKSVDEEATKPSNESQLHLPDSQVNKVIANTEDENDRLKGVEMSKEDVSRKPIENVNNNSAPLIEKDTVDKIVKKSTDTVDTKIETSYVTTKSEESGIYTTTFINSINFINFIFNSVSFFK
jgi:uncharacterized protein YdcH (DUF465 family)